MGLGRGRDLRVVRSEQAARRRGRAEEQGCAERRGSVRMRREKDGDSYLHCGGHARGRRRETSLEPSSYKHKSEPS